ncbi:MAG: SUF system NifU family Fe-S cluster assembly protein [Gemmatirosa sp.]|nr:SUF system NifU family Fe-S cluster assembly protein [Gemmatirosa sp.]
MSDLTELYQSVILDHNRRPRNRGAMEGADAHADGKNPLCGDRLTVWVKLDGDTLADVRFEGAGCAISQASASLMTQAVKGRSRDDAEALFEQVHAMLLGKAPAPEGATGAMRSLAALSGVSRFPVRVKCASLAWHTLRAALADGTAVTTE